MKNYLTYILFILCTFITHYINGQEKQVWFENLSVHDGLSQISVLCIYQDTKGYMWFGTRDGLNRYNGYKFDCFLYDPIDENSISNNYIRCISGTPDGHLWIGTTNGLNRFNPDTHTFTRYYINPGRRTGNFNEIISVFSNRNGEVYIGTYYGLFTYDKETDSVVALEELNERIYCISQIENKLYIGTGNGFTIFDPATGEIQTRSPFHAYPPLSSRNQINTIYQDRTGRIWIGSNYKGLALYNPENGEITQHTTTIGNNSSYRNNEISLIRETPDGHLLIGTYGGIYIYHPENQQFSVYPSGKETFTNQAIEDICIDQAGSIWIGTYSAGVYYSNRQAGRFRYFKPENENHRTGTTGPMAEYKNEIWIGTETGGLIAFNKETEEFRYFPYKGLKEDAAIRNNNIKSLLINGDMLYIGVYSGSIYQFDLKKQTYIHEAVIPERTAIYSILKTSKENEFLVGTYSYEGLNIYRNGKIERYNLQTNDSQPVQISQISVLLNSAHDNELFIGTRSNGLYHFTDGYVNHYSTEDNSGLSGNRITTLYKDKNGTLLVGTSDNGMNLFNSHTKRFITLNRQNGLRDDTICSITEDNQQNLWVITRLGISKIDSLYQVEHTYNLPQESNIQEFSPGSILVSNENKIYIGGDNGFLSFNLDELNDNPFIPPVVIHAVSVNNHPRFINFSEKNPSLKLNHNEANLTIEYSSLNYIYPRQNKYAYMLEGVDKNWNYVNDIRSVNYANLAPGEYTFKVKGSNNDGLWNEEGAALHILVKPPFWISGYAIIAYILIITTLLYIFFRQYRARQELHHQVLLNRQEEKLYKARIDLFTNFSHELRTPLSLITGPVEDALMSENPEQIGYNSLRLIHSNIKRMLVLIDQLMTFRKNETGSLELHVAEGDFAGFAREIVIAFRELAHSRNIELKFEIENLPGSVWYDRSLFEKVLMNLLSNAFKFTPEKGTILLKLYCKKEQQKEYLQILVEDNGPGVPDSELEKIFDPFYQASTSHQGTGIGLSLTRGIVKMHHGTITAENKPERGLRLVISLPAGNSHFDPKEIVVDYHDSEDIVRYYSSDEESPENIAEVIPIIEKEETTHLTPDKEKVILVVEDNPELRKYICSRLQPYYKVIEAENGQQGKSLAIATIPTLIISDIMMPVMDGLAMCKELKDDMRTCHIPIILLTARSFILQMKEGLEFGADDYITKPFNTSILLLKMKNIIASRENLKNLYGKNLALENMGVDIQSADDKFLQKLNQVIEKNIADPNLNMEKFCDEIGMSRASLYRKLIATTNMSPLKYVQSVRLHLAAKMLRETDLSISDISDTTGFGSLIHFSASFKKQYGVSPSKYKKENTDK